MRTKLIRYIVLGSAFLLAFPAFVAAQDQESVADAARKAEAEKKATDKPPKVFTNDDIDSLKGPISIVGPPPAPVSTDVPDKTKAAAAPAGKDAAYWRQAFADARRKLADDAKELDVLQREYNLKQIQYYSDPNQAMREQYTRQDLNATKTQIDEKTADVEKDKQTISDLDDALRMAGGDPGWATPPDNSTPDTTPDTQPVAPPATEIATPPTAPAPAAQ